MGFKTNEEDKAEGVAYAEGSSASDLLHRIGSDYYEVEFKDEQFYVYDNNLYKVTVIIEPA